MTSLPERLRSHAALERASRSGSSASLLTEAADELDRRAVTIQRLMDQARVAAGRLYSYVPDPYPGEVERLKDLLTQAAAERQTLLRAITMLTDALDAEGKGQDAPDQTDAPIHGTDPPLYEEPKGRLVVDRYVTRREMSHALAVFGAVILNPDVRVERSE